MKILPWLIITFLFLLVCGCQIKTASYIREDGVKVKYTDYKFLVWTSTKDLDAKFDGAVFGVGSTATKSDPNSIKAAGGAVGEAGKVILGIP